VDYHLPIWDKLGKLEAFIRQEAGESTALRSYVDTGPVLERGFAAAAGLGQTGKNACLIIQGTGSYFFLAEILTDLPLPIDPPYTRDLCGSCQRCIDACPTQCILPNRSLDARRCISYLTIEHKGIIPDDLKPQMGDWVFGCDICQMVCPHNAWTPEQDYPLGQNNLPAQMDLIDLFALDQAAFKQRFKDTPMERTKRKGLLRNAAIALGNQKVEAALPALGQALETESDEGLLDACRWAIRQIKNDSNDSTREKSDNDNQ
jgi:epoxyqueuosine reductase